MTIIQTCTHCSQAGTYTEMFVFENVNSPVGHEGLHMPEVQLVLKCCSGLEPNY